MNCRKLDTVQTQENLNTVFAVDEKGNGGANHAYVVSCYNGGLLSEHVKVVKHSILFQNGARHEEGSISGVIDSDLLEIVRDRYKSFQVGPYASEYNAKALEHIEQALYWMNKRVEDRIARDVLGKNEK